MVGVFCRRARVWRVLFRLGEGDQNSKGDLFSRGAMQVEAAARRGPAAGRASSQHLPSSVAVSAARLEARRDSDGDDASRSEDRLPIE